MFLYSNYLSRICIYILILVDSLTIYCFCICDCVWDAWAIVSCFIRAYVFSQQSCVLHFLKKICHIQVQKSSCVQVCLLGNWYAGFIDTIIKQTSVARKLFSFKCKRRRGHCMKNIRSVWSRWSPAHCMHYLNILGSQNFRKGSKALWNQYQSDRTKYVATNGKFK